jgi:hypothetical protein
MMTSHLMIAFLVGHSLVICFTALIDHIRPQIYQFSDDWNSHYSAAWLAVMCVSLIMMFSPYSLLMQLHICVHLRIWILLRTNWLGPAFGSVSNINAQQGCSCEHSFQLDKQL